MQTSPPSDQQATATLDPAEVERFKRMAPDWWNPDGKFRPLHKIGPARIQYLRDEICRRFGRDARADRPLAGLSLIDIGCGGGLVSEPLAKLGAKVTGIDPGAANIEVARDHAGRQGVEVDYRTCLIEDVAAGGETFDVVACLEVVEHVPDVGTFLQTVARTVRPGGLLICSTINRNLKSFALAIVGAEYVLGWLPRSTHDWNRFVTPEELAAHLKPCGLEAPESTGLVYNPLIDRWDLSADTGVNYFAAASKPA